MLHQIRKHPKKDRFLVSLQGLDQKLVIMTKEKETATGARTLTGFKNHAAVVFEVEAVHDILGFYTIQFHNFLKQIRLKTRDLTADFDIWGYSFLVALSADLTLDLFHSWIHT